LINAAFRFLYTLFLAVDANFKLKGKARKINDVELAPGLGCFVEENGYQRHLTQYVNESEVKSHSMVPQIHITHSYCRSVLAFRNMMQLFAPPCDARQVTTSLAQGLSFVRAMGLSVATVLETFKRVKGAWYDSSLCHTHFSLCEGTRIWIISFFALCCSRPWPELSSRMTLRANGPKICRNGWISSPKKYS
jgi:hypothetical protein